MKLLMFNLKANKTYDEMLDYLRIFKGNDNMVIFPSSLYLSMFNNKDILFGAQDVSKSVENSSTGEVLASQIKSTGASFVIIGHSERRTKFLEDECVLLKKINNALDNNLKIVYCVGETKEERLRKKTYQIIEKQIAKVFNNIEVNKLKNIIIAYEPIWAIGNGNSANTNDIEEIITFIKKLVKDYYDVKLKVLYGGSVDPDNVIDYNKISVIDGYLIGKSSLDLNKIKKIISNSTK